MFEFLESIAHGFTSAATSEASAPAEPPVLNRLRPGPSLGELRPDPVETARLAEHWVDEGTPDTVYLGLNDVSRDREAALFADDPNVQIIKGSEKNGWVTGPDGTEYDLSDDLQVVHYLDAIGVDEVRTDASGTPIESEVDAMDRVIKLTNVIAGDYDPETGESKYGLSNDTRDEAAQLIALMQRAERGEVELGSMILSGHSHGQSLFNEAGNQNLPFSAMASMMRQFPETQAGIEDVMVSGCHSLEAKYFTDDGSVYKDMFPGLERVWGYDGKSPDSGEGSTRHIRRWFESLGDPDSMAAAAKRTHSAARLLTYGDSDE